MFDLFKLLTQNNRLLRLHTPLGEGALMAEAFEGWEAIGEGGYRFDLTALSEDSAIDTAELIGKAVLLEWQTAVSRTELRPFHAHVTAFERLGSNGGLTRYRLTMEPWLSLLRYRQDSFAFQDMSVRDITESIFSDYANQGALLPAWRWELNNADDYLRRSLTTQYQETDFEFLRRLWAEEGLFYWFEHTGNPQSESLGEHTLVIADHNGAFGEAPFEKIRFHRASATEKTDTIQKWEVARRWRTDQVERASWDYRTLSMRPASMLQKLADTSTQQSLPSLVDIDVAGPYAYRSAAEGARRARQHLEALQVETHTVNGSGEVRSLAPGQAFVLIDHPNYDESDDINATFVCTRVAHRARNNLGADVESQLETLLGKANEAMPSWPRALAGVAGKTLGATQAQVSALHAHDNRSKVMEHALNVAKRLNLASSLLGELTQSIHKLAEIKNDKAPAGSKVDFYQNRFAALPLVQPYRAQTQDGHGAVLNPKPTVTGTQTAIVVGAGDPIHTDRDHRIKVQFHWQRGANTTNQLAHPSDDDNASGNSSLGTWVRVLTPVAGQNWGGHFVPRVGQEVLIAFLEGDIDRPVMVGALYNGQGQDDAAHNQIAGGGANATGNAPAWFAGNDHKAILTGFKTQTMSASQKGGGAHNRLQFDDTPLQAHVELFTSLAETSLTIGHLKYTQDNQRQSDRGYGFEIRTQAHGALRAGSGLLLTTESSRTNQLDSPIALQALSDAEQLVQGMQTVAKNQKADLPKDPKPEESLSVIALQHTQTVMKTSGEGSISGEGVGGGQGGTVSWSEPLMAVSSPAGIAALTPGQQIWVSGTQTILSASHDINWVSQGETSVAVAGAVSLFTYGKADNKEKPNQETGIALHAAQGKVSVQAQAGKMEYNAQKQVTIASSNAGIGINSPKKILITAASAFIKMEGSDLEIGAPGKVEFKAGKKVLTTPKSANAKVKMPKGKYKGCEFKLRGADAGGDGVVAVGT
jgi:type VI secretion system secreted protein VgrG